MLRQVFAPGSPGGTARLARTPLAALAAIGIIVTSNLAFAKAPPDGFADLAEKVTPAVVNISTTQKVERSAEQMPELPFPPDSPMGEMLRKFFEQQQGNNGQPARPRNVSALGSGFIIDPTGYVVTNNHVVGQADQIKVILSGGETFDAKLVGRDEKTDLALLKVDAKRPLPFVNFGDSDKARVGDWVMAVGNPFGLGGTVTAGIVSARGRDIHSGPYDDYIQTDAAINRGNSGGPMFDMSGAVIGINSAIYSPNGGSVGIGFAVPSSTAKPVIAELRENGKVSRGWLGVQIQEVTPEIAASVGLADGKGAIVSSIMPKSPASSSDLKLGDVILSVNDTEITRLRDLPRIIAETKAGQTVKLAVWREGNRKNVDVTIKEMPATDQVAAAGEENPAARVQPARVLGMALAPVSRDAKQRFQLSDDVKGAVVTAVTDGSEAAERGIQAGDVIVRVGDKPVTAPADVTRQVKEASSAKRDAVLLLVNRRGAEQFVALKLEKA
jgi:serine protease Do